MGRGVNYQCNYCGYEVTLLEGFGFSFFEDCIREKEKMLLGKYGKKWQKLAEEIPVQFPSDFFYFKEGNEILNEKEDDDSSENTLPFYGGVSVVYDSFICDTCKHISSKKKISILIKDGYMTMPIKCKKCRTLERKLQTSDLEYCPRCKEKRILS